MAKGTIAKQEVISKIQSAFGSDFAGENAGKAYVWADDGGERVQIAIALTCPKVPYGEAPAQTLDFDLVETPKPQVDVTQEEKDNLAQMMARLGL